MCTHTHEKCGPSRGRVGLLTPSFHPSDNSRRLLVPVTVREHLLFFCVGGHLLQKPQETGTYWEAVRYVLGGISGNVVNMRPHKQSAPWGGFSCHLPWKAFSLHVPGDQK